MFKNGFQICGALTNVMMAGVLLLVLAIAANAYTLVFRDGRRIEIPSEFTLTKTTLTYEVSPGFSKTMQLILIDVAATERANNEAPGSFFKHTQAAPVAAQPAPPAAQPAPPAAQPAPRASRTLVNSDLVAIRQRRIQSEQAYEKRRVQLGLPTLEESRRHQADEEAAVRTELRRESETKAREETYWRERARDLRTEIAMVDTQIDFLRGRLNDLGESSLTTRSWVTGVYPLWQLGNRQWLGNGQWQSPGNRQFRGFRQARPIFGSGLPYPYGYPASPYGYPAGPFDNFGNSSERVDLTTRLDDLLVRRVGLSAEWRALEDDARDARVPQVWLEP